MPHEEVVTSFNLPFTLPLGPNLRKGTLFQTFQNSNYHLEHHNNFTNFGQHFSFFLSYDVEPHQGKALWTYHGGVNNNILVTISFTQSNCLHAQSYKIYNSPYQNYQQSEQTTLNSTQIHIKGTQKVKKSFCS